MDLLRERPRGLGILEMIRQNRIRNKHNQQHFPPGRGGACGLDTTFIDNRYANQTGKRVIVSWILMIFMNTFALSLSAQTPIDPVAANKRCLECHGQAHIAELTPDERVRMVGTRLSPQSEDESGSENNKDITNKNTNEIQNNNAVTKDQNTINEEAPPVRPGLYVRPDALNGSVHKGLSCVECHTDAAQLPHRAKLNLFSCATECHSVQAESFAQSIHMKDRDANKDEQTPGCAYCHGGHQIQPVSDPTAPVYRLKSVELCSKCHRQHAEPTPEGFISKEHIDAYLDSTHGRAITQRGLIVAATCADCHGMHEVRPAADPKSKVHRDHVPATCGKCHIGVMDDYEKSIHGKLLAEGDDRAPTCTDCHTAHHITKAFGDDIFLTAVVTECGECHNKPTMAENRRTTFYESYRASYHGQVNTLGSNLAARCSDCHGYHDILPADDPQSKINNNNLPTTCGTADCHPNATTRFVLFDPHADYRDRSRYPVLFAVWLYFVIVMTGAFGFFGLHTILWFIRSLIERIRNVPTPKPKTQTTAIRRFTLVNRINHAFVIITFFGLTATGLPLVFSGHYWSGPLISIFGGVRSAGILHRIFAVMLIMNFVVHFTGLAISANRCRKRESLWRNWLTGPNSMLPRWKDITDCLAMFRWFFKGGKEPTFDRFTYWEKFDYWAEIGGSGIIGISGLLLWFPEVASAIFPGWIFNVAMVVHGYEALLAICFIFTIHFFNAHLRFEKFPVDDVMFTGSLPEDEFKHERKSQYDRLVKNGRLEELRVEPPPTWQRPLAVTAGILAMAIGTTLVILIILSGIENLSG